MTRKSKHTEHDFSELAAFGQTVHPDILGRIHQLVQEGTTSVQEVKKCLRYFVKNIIFAGKEKPDNSCRAFYPTAMDVANHIFAVLKKLHDPARLTKKTCRHWLKKLGVPTQVTT